MTKIKINLASGNVVEKPLVTCFRGANGDYLVLDNETNGSMGLPIICISKFTGTSAEKIFDQTEWASVKENLKSIIAGNNLPYLKVPENITAQDDFFTQLTLPVASFDLLKNVYQVPQEVAPVVETAPVTPIQEVTPIEPVMPAFPAMEPAATLSAAPVIDPVMPAFNMPVTPDPMPVVNPQPVSPVPSPVPAFDTPVVNNPAPVMPTFEPMAPLPVEPITPAVDIEPVSMMEQSINTFEPTVAPNVELSNTMDSEIKAIKDNFMESCETMFNALLKKFQNK